jgi:hypothetical protein
MAEQGIRFVIQLLRFHTLRNINFRLLTPRRNGSIQE